MPQFDEVLKVINQPLPFGVAVLFVLLSGLHSVSLALRVVALVVTDARESVAEAGHALRRIRGALRKPPAPPRRRRSTRAAIKWLLRRSKSGKR